MPIEKQTPCPSLDPACNFPSLPLASPLPHRRDPERIWVRCQAKVLPANKSHPVHPRPRCSLLIPLRVWLNVTASEFLSLSHTHAYRTQTKCVCMLKLGVNPVKLIQRFGTGAPMILFCSLSPSCQ